MEVSQKGLPMFILILLECDLPIDGDGSPFLLTGVLHVGHNAALEQLLPNQLLRFTDGPISAASMDILPLRVFVMLPVWSSLMALATLSRASRVWNCMYAK